MSRDEHAPPLVVALPFAGLAFGVGLVFVLARGALRETLREAGSFGYMTLGAGVLMALVAGALLALARRGRPGLAALTPALALFPYLVTALGLVLGMRMVTGVIGGTEYETAWRILGAGTAELMSMRSIGAAVTLGLALGLASAFVLLHGARKRAGSDALDSALAAFVLFTFVALAAAVLSDARAVTTLMGSIRFAKAPEAALILGEALSAARTRGLALDALLGLTIIALVAGIILARRRREKGAAALVVSAIACVLFGATDFAVANAVSKLALASIPSIEEPGFEPLSFPAQDATVERALGCIARIDGVRCADRALAPYDARGEALARALRPTDAMLARRRQEEEHIRADELARMEPLSAISVAIDARLRAHELRVLLRAAQLAGHDVMEIRGAVIPHGFRTGFVPAWLRALAPVRTSTIFLLEHGVAGASPPGRVVTVRDDDTARSLITRTERDREGAVLVTAFPLGERALGPARDSGPATTPPPPPALEERMGETADRTFDRLGDMLEATPDGAPAPAGRALDAATVQRVLRSHLAEVRACYDAALAEHPDAGGRMDARLEIAPSGRVTGVRITGTMTEPAVAACTERVLRGVRFPASDRTDAMVVTYPFFFAPPR